LITGTKIMFQVSLSSSFKVALHIVEVRTINAPFLFTLTIWCISATIWREHSWVNQFHHAEHLAPTEALVEARPNVI
jgi:hypothetical protein